MIAAQFDPQWLEGHDLLYFRLHGLPGQVGWFGDNGLLALTRVHVDVADLGGAVVVVANCYSADNDPMVDALRRAGSEAVIAGPGPNLAAGNKIVGTDLLVQWIIRGLRVGMGPRKALAVARMRLGLTAWRASDRDARGFRIEN